MRTSGEVLVISMVKVTSPPGSGTAVGDAVFCRPNVGSRSMMLNVALSLSMTSVPSLSEAVAVTVSVSLAPASPVSEAGMVHWYEPAGAIVWGTSQSPCPSRSPSRSSSRLVSSTGSTADWFTTLMRMS